MDCNCYVHLVAHQPDCPAHNPPLTEEERTILAHYRGDCHDSAACRACKSEFGSAAAVTTERLARREAEQQRDTAKRDVRDLRESLRHSNVAAARRLREWQAEQLRHDSTKARLESVITGLSYVTPPQPVCPCERMGYGSGHARGCDL